MRAAVLVRLCAKTPCPIQVRAPSVLSWSGARHRRMLRAGLFHDPQHGSQKLSSLLEVAGEGELALMCRSTFPIRVSAGEQYARTTNWGDARCQSAIPTQLSIGSATESRSCAETTWVTWLVSSSPSGG